MTKVTNKNVIIFNFEKCSFSLPPNSFDDEYDSSDDDDSDSVDDCDSVDEEEDSGDEYDSDPDNDSDEEDDIDDSSDDDDDDDDIERFKRVEGYNNYSTSTFGNVRIDKTNRILKDCKIKSGYHQVGLRKNGKEKRCYIHRLVAITFIPNPNNMPKVEHIDRDKTNNHTNNFRWASSVQLAQNRDKQSNNTSGFKGVSYHKPAKKYRARIRIGDNSHPFKCF